MEFVGSREMERALGKSPSHIRRIAEALPIEPHGMSGKARRYTLLDGVLILIAHDIRARGFPVDVSLKFATAMAPALETVVASESPAWLCAMPGAGDESGYETAIHFDKHRVAEMILAESELYVFDIRAMVKDAMVLWLMAKKAEART